jgi:hypothetical protein
MVHYTGHIADSGIDSLRAILDAKPIRTVYAPAVTARFGDGAHEVHELVFWLGRHDFVVLTTQWVTTRRGFDYHIYEIQRSSRPGKIPYFPDGRPEGGSKLPHLGTTSSVEVHLGEVTKIDVIEASCSTTYPSDADPETIDYDYCLKFFGTEASMRLTTSFDSILGAIELRQGTELDPNDSIDDLRSRLTLERTTTSARHRSA